MAIAAFGPSGPSPLIVDPMGVTGFLATGPSGEYFIPYQHPISLPTYIMTITDLMNSHEALVQQESVDAVTLSQLSSPDEGLLKVALFQWARAGFTNIYPVLSLTLAPPPVCVDGVSRTLFDYVPYLTGKSVAELMDVLQLKLNGIQLSYSLPSNSIVFHVSK